MKSFDIGKLPKEAIFSLLMQVDPEEIGSNWKLES